MAWTQEEFVSDDGTTLAEYRWPAVEPTAHVIIFHGIAEHLGRYDHVAESLTAAELSVSGIDMRGHGRSPVPWTALDSYDRWLDDHAAYVQRSVEEATVPVFVIGHSLGGCLSLTLAGQGRLSVAGLITSGAAVKVSEDISLLARKASVLLSKAIPGTGVPVALSKSISRDPAVVAAYESDPLVHQRIPARIGAEGIAVIEQCADRLSAIELPLLVLHGSADHLTDPVGLDLIRSRVVSDDATYHLLDGWYHELFHEPDHEELIADIVTWIQARS